MAELSEQELSEQEEELYSCEEELSCGQEEEEEELYSCEELSFGQEEELSCEDEEKVTYDSLSSLLCNEDRDFLIRSNGQQVKVEELKNKYVGLYFSADGCGPCNRFTSILSNVYNKLSDKGDFEIVFVSYDFDEESFKEYYDTMPWLALPFSDQNSRNKLDKAFPAVGIPSLILLDKEGRVITTQGVNIIKKHGVEVYPITAERVAELRVKEERLKRQVPVAELAGKTVGLYFSAQWCPPCRNFTPVLSKIYKKLSKNGDFEIVFVSADEDEKSFEEYQETMPWLALPFSDKNSKKKLEQAFQIQSIPSLIILDEEGRVITTEGVDIIRKYDVEGCSFTAERLDELRSKDEPLTVAQTVQSLLLSDERDYLIRRPRGKVPVAELAGKTVGLYFSAHWCDPCKNFTPVLSEIYEKLSENGDFEIVFVSADSDEKSFEKYHETMPWLALPFSDKNSKEKLEQCFQIQSIPSLIILDKECRVITTEGVYIIRKYDDEGCSFTAERLDELRSKEEEPLRVAQTVESLLLSDERDYLIRPLGKAKKKPRAAQTGETVIESLLLTNERDYLLRNREKGDHRPLCEIYPEDDSFSKVPVAELAGKTVGLYFGEGGRYSYRDIMELIDLYNGIKEEGKAFEIVYISYNVDDEDFKLFFSKMPWLALPFEDRDTEKKLSRYCRVRWTPTFAIISPDGEIVQANAYPLVRKYGMNAVPAYPFTKERVEEFEAEEDKREAEEMEEMEAEEKAWEQAKREAEDKAKREAEEIEDEDKAKREAEEIEA